MINFFDNVSPILDSIQKEFLNGTLNYMPYAKGIAGLGMLVSVYTSFFKLMASTEGVIEKWLGKFLLIFIFLFYYQTFILAINFPLEIISKAICVSNKGDIAVLDALHKAKDNNTVIFSSDPTKDAALSDYTPSDPVSIDDSQINSGSTAPQVAENADADKAGYFTTAITESVNYIMQDISVVALSVLLVLRCFFLIVLSVFGIFVIPISTFPTFENSITHWLHHYVNVYLWLPVGYILQSVLIKVQIIYLQSEPTDVKSGMSSLIMLISITTILGFFAVPTLSSWLINAGTSAMASKVSGKVATIGQIIK